MKGFKVGLGVGTQENQNSMACQEACERPPDGLVKDDKCFLACLLRMHMTNEAVTLWSASRDFRIMLRNDPEEADTIAFQICLVDDDEGQKGLSRVLELEYDGYFEDATFVMETYSFDRDELIKSPDLLSPARNRLNEIHSFRLCPCGAYFIKDGAKMCLFCQLTGESLNAPEHICAICHDTSVALHMVTQPCCGQLLHKSCLACWTASSGQLTCPLCRAAM